MFQIKLAWPTIVFSFMSLLWEKHTERMTSKTSMTVLNTMAWSGPVSLTNEWKRQLYTLQNHVPS